MVSKVTTRWLLSPDLGKDQPHLHMQTRNDARIDPRFRVPDDHAAGLGAKTTGLLTVCKEK